MKRIMASLKVYIEDQRKCMIFFTRSAFFFFIGLACIVGSNYTATPSVKQELTALLGVIVMITGFGCAITAQICMIIARLKTPKHKR